MATKPNYDAELVEVCRANLEAARSKERDAHHTVVVATAALRDARANVVRVRTVAAALVPADAPWFTALVNCGKKLDEPGRAKLLEELKKYNQQLADAVGAALKETKS